MKKNKILFLVSLLFVVTFQTINATQNYVYMTNGKLYFPSGKELSLWGVNFQPCLSWEYNQRLKLGGIQQTATDLKTATNSGLDDLQNMGVNLIRCHLTPADFTDANGNLVQTVYLDMLDYLISEASKRNIYLSITLINHMGCAYVPGSFLNDNAPDSREKLVFDTDQVTKSKNYIAALLNRTNPYTQLQYKSTPSIAVWEILNEPKYYSYDSIKNTVYYSNYLNWITVNRSSLNNLTTYADYRTQLVQNYINDMRSLIHNSGAPQPVVWNCNWNGMITGNNDVFQGIAQSDIDVVSFCCYPGQCLLPVDYWNHPQDLTTTDYSSFLSTNFTNYDGYGWTQSSAFKNKAKVVYEFEELYNQSSYLYPVMAQYFRSLGVQAATMWTYTFGKAAPYVNGSHFLNLSCTPAKSASFVVAHTLFDSTVLYTSFNLTLPNEQKGSNFFISKSKDLSVFTSVDQFYSSGPVSDTLKLIVSKKAVSIVGRGNTPIVKYNGSGDYIIRDINNELFLTVKPNYTWLREPWNSVGTGMVTKLDSSTLNTMSITLDNWGTAIYTFNSLVGTQRKKLSILTTLQNINLLPGNYVVVKGINTDVSQTKIPSHVYWSNGHLMVERDSYETVQIYSTVGKLLVTHSMRGLDEVDLSTLSQGLYIISLFSGNECVNLKVPKD